MVWMKEQNFQELPNYTLKINDNTLEISVDLPGGEEVNDEIKWDPTTQQFTFSLKAKKKKLFQ